MNLFLRTALAGVALFALTASCMKKPELEQDDGPAVDASVVQNALVKGWGTATSSSIGKSEFTTMNVYRTFINIPDLPPAYLLQDAKTVKSRRSSADNKSWIFTVDHHVVEDPNGAQKPSDEELNTPEFPKDMFAAPALDEAFSRVTEKGAPSTPWSLQLMVAMYFICTDPEKGTCHNLVVSDQVSAPPAAVAARTGCEGLPNCKWTQRTVAFDYVTQLTDPETNTTARHKERYTIRMSPEAPYLSRVTDFCYAYVASTSTTKVPVEDCYKLMDFRRGTPF